MVGANAQAREKMRVKRLLMWYSHFPEGNVSGLHGWVRGCGHSRPYISLRGATMRGAKTQASNKILSDIAMIVELVS